MSKSCKEYFGERLRTLRLESGMSQESLSKELNISQSALGYYENCGRTPDIEFLEKVSNYFDVSVDYLLGHSQARTSETEQKTVCDYIGITDGTLSALKEVCNNKTSGGLYSYAFRLLCESGELKKICSALGQYLDLWDYTIHLKSQRQNEEQEYTEALEDLELIKLIACNTLSKSIDIIQKQWLENSIKDITAKIERTSAAIEKYDHYNNLRNKLKGSDENG